jgi:hypothetical protein
MKTFGGYTADSSFFEMDWHQFRDYAAGQLTLAIGQGKFREELWTVISLAHARGMKRQQELIDEEKKAKKKA